MSSVVRVKSGRVRVDAETKDVVLALNVRVDRTRTFRVVDDEGDVGELAITVKTTTGVPLVSEEPQEQPAETQEEQGPISSSRPPRHKGGANPSKRCGSCGGNRPRRTGR